MPVNFFVVIADSDGERFIRHISVSGEVQNELADHFQTMHVEFVGPNNEEVPFDPCFYPDEDQIFVIRPFALPTFMNAVAGSASAVKSLSDKDMNESSLKAFLAANREGSQLKDLVVQGIDSRQLLKHSKISLIYEGERFRRLEKPGLTVGDSIVAVFKSQALYFKNFHMLRRVFDLTDYFHEATDEQLKSFLGYSNFLVADMDRTLTECDTWIRKRVFNIINSKILETCSISKLAKVAKRYGIELELKGQDNKKKIVLREDRKYLKNVVRLLDDDFLDSSLTDRSFLVNSKLALNAS